MGKNNGGLGIGKKYSKSLPIKVLKKLIYNSIGSDESIEIKLFSDSNIIMAWNTTFFF